MMTRNYAIHVFCVHRLVLPSAFMLDRTVTRSPVLVTLGFFKLSIIV